MIGSHDITSDIGPPPREANAVEGRRLWALVRLPDLVFQLPQGSLPQALQLQLLLMQQRVHTTASRVIDLHLRFRSRLERSSEPHGLEGPDGASVTSFAMQGGTFGGKRIEML